MQRLLGCAWFLACTAAAAGPLDAVMPPGSRIEGRTAEALSAAWWQWAETGPKRTNPVRDRNGRWCAVGQSGPVWFLAGGFGSARIRRECAVPAGKHLFFPIINFVHYRGEDNEDFTCEDARADVAAVNDRAAGLFVRIDGVPVRNPAAFRAGTKTCFSLFERHPDPAVRKAGEPAASDGYWVMLRPLEPGRHHLQFGGHYLDEGGAEAFMVQDIEYFLEVK